MKDDKYIRHSEHFVMLKSVHRTQHGRGSRFQNHKVTSYKITSTKSKWSSAWTPNADEVSKLINADFVRVNGRRVWKFYNKRDADRAWVLLGLKYGT